ncbi:MAG: hypothetical protein M2R45_01551 [Verrucomicrobia subdivision 3 bacterium]|nr:hypothetical protein [Limisphaerales bacterium]MCS1413321.1 hypothetical protein [Limisphaerales bacterium]
MKIIPVELEHACQSRTATDIDDLLAYLTTGAGAPLDLIRKMRAVPETHCWTAYPVCLFPNRAGYAWQNRPEDP